MALGATSSGIVRLVLTHAGRLVAVGVGLGFLVSFSALAILNAIVPLENVSLLDGSAFAAGVAIVTLSALPATMFPSHRAARVDPSHVLRAEG
jgi:ABC-type antimicrobial peptide transport system permease subunit